jgi:hypothetical protein
VSADTEKKVFGILSALGDWLHDNVVLNPSPEMLRKRLTGILAQIIGDHVIQTAEEHVTITQIDDEVILEIDEHMSGVISSVFGNSLLEALCCERRIVLKGWSARAPRCDRIETAKLPDAAPPRPRSQPSASTKPKVTKPRARPRSRNVWD